MKFTNEQWEKTAVFLQKHARPLEQTLFNYHFGRGSVEAVLDALAAFQNEDGGFGHGLEPDVQMAESSVLATTVAFQILRSLQVDKTHPLVQGGVAYLENLYSAAQQSWPFVAVAVANAPHAPWWQHDANFTNYWHNPRPEVLGYLLEWGNEDWEGRLLTAVLDTAATTGTIEFHAIFCYQRLLKTAVLPTSARAALQPIVKKWAVQLVETNPEKWVEYGLRPLAFAPTPNDFLADHFAEAIERELDYLVQTLQSDGAWHPAWSWGEMYPDVWPQAATAWKGVITLNNLLTLQAHGRLPDGAGR